MHETSIVKNILEIVSEEMRKSRLRRLKSLKLRIGELTAVEPEALRFSFEACAKGTDMEGALLVIEEAPLSGRCTKCGTDYLPKNFSPLCPKCKKPLEVLSGTELDIISMEAV